MIHPVTKTLLWITVLNARPYTYHNVRTIRAFFAVVWPYYDENKLCVSYSHRKFTKVSTECVIDSRIQRLVGYSECVANSTKYNCIYHTRTLFRKGTYLRSHLSSSDVLTFDPACLYTARPSVHVTWKLGRRYMRKCIAPRSKRTDFPFVMPPVVLCFVCRERERERLWSIVTVQNQMLPNCRDSWRVHEVPIDSAEFLLITVALSAAVECRSICASLYSTDRR